MSLTRAGWDPEVSSCRSPPAFRSGACLPVRDSSSLLPCSRHPPAALRPTVPGEPSAAVRTGDGEESRATRTIRHRIRFLPLYKGDEGRGRFRRITKPGVPADPPSSSESSQGRQCRGWGKNVSETGPKRHGARGGAKTFWKRDPKDTVQGVGQKRFGNGTQKTRCKGWGENVSETGPEKFSGQGTINRRRRASYLARGVWQRRLSCGSDRPD